MIEPRIGSVLIIKDKDGKTAYRCVKQPALCQGCDMRISACKHICCIRVLRTDGQSIVLKEILNYKK